MKKFLAALVLVLGLASGAQACNYVSAAAFAFTVPVVQAVAVPVAVPAYSAQAVVAVKAFAPVVAVQAVKVRVVRAAAVRSVTRTRTVVRR